MIIVGIDDTDVAGSRGTNQLAREIVRELARRWRCVRIVRHQLLDDPRVPCTTKNGSASITLQRRCEHAFEPNRPGMEQTESDSLLEDCCRVMRHWFVEGSDPGLCLLDGDCPLEIVDWGHRCQRTFVTRGEAIAIAFEAGVHLEGLGGTHDGVIGALAAVGLASTENDGRIVQLGEWPDDLSGVQAIDCVRQRGVRVCEYGTGRQVTHGAVDLGKRLRPNLRSGWPVLFVEPLATASARSSPHESGRHETEGMFQAVRLP